MVNLDKIWDKQKVENVFDNPNPNNQQNMNDERLPQDETPIPPRNNQQNNYNGGNNYGSQQSNYNGGNGYNNQQQNNMPPRNNQQNNYNGGTGYNNQQQNNMPPRNNQQSNYNGGNGYNNQQMPPRNNQQNNYNGGTGYNNQQKNYNEDVQQGFAEKENSALEKLRSSFEKDNKPQSSTKAEFDEETENTLNELFGNINPDMKLSKARLLGVRAFKADANSQNPNMNKQEGHTFFLDFATVDPYSNMEQQGYWLKLSVSTVTKDTRNLSSNNFDFEVLDETVKKYDYLVRSVFGKYGVNGFYDLPKLNDVIQQNSQTPVMFNAYWKTTKQNTSQGTQTRVNYYLTNHGYFGFEQGEEVGEVLYNVCQQAGGRLPVKIVKIKDNGLLKRFEITMKTSYSGREHTYIKGMSYAQTRGANGKKLSLEEQRNAFPDNVKRIAIIEKLQNKYRIGFKDFNQISDTVFINDYISVKESTLKKSNGTPIYYIDID